MDKVYIDMAARHKYKQILKKDDNEEEVKKRKADKLERISAKVHAIFWVVSAILLIKYTDVYNLVLYSEKVNRIALNVAIVCFFSNMCIMLYLTFWLPLVQKVTTPWEIYCPNMIPTSTALGVTCVILLMISFWPVWGMLTPLIVTIMLLGFLFLSHFIPWC